MSRGIAALVEDKHLNTVCQEARCPNLFECWGVEKTATFMLMGDVCTRRCGFCAVTQGAGKPLDPEEPRHVAEAVRTLGLAHAVVTSVNRDELPDGGAAHFAATIREIRALTPGVTIEVLIPDFLGSEAALGAVLGPRSSTTTRRPSSASTGACGRKRSTRGRWSCCAELRRGETKRRFL
jgi:lipoic acid synthetase